jgi:hypothetical protein
MEYTKFQQKYIDEVEGRAHMNAVEIIGLLEKTIEAQSRLLTTAYRLGERPPEWVFDAMNKAREAGIDV